MTLTLDRTAGSSRDKTLKVDRRTVASRVDAPADGAVERRVANRRGPMRPAALTPTRSRLTGWMLGAIFRGADVLALAAIALAAASLSVGRMGPASLAPFVVGALILIWGLSTLHAYAFTQREDLVRHLV